MAAFNVSEGVAEKFDLILAKLCSLDSKMEDLNKRVKSLKSKLSFMEIDIDSVKAEQTNLDEKFTHMETNSKFVDDRIHYFPIVHNALCLPLKFCINYCCEILLGDLHIPKSILQQ